MQKIFLAVLLLLCTSAHAQDYWCLNRHISFFGDYVYFRRQEIRNLRLVEDISLGMTHPKKVISTENLEDRLGWESGFRAGGVYRFNACSSIEAFYTYVDPWTATTDATADGTLQIPFHNLNLVDDFVNADKAVAKYRSRLQDGQVNYWGHITPQRVNYFSFSWILGFRWIDLNERFNLAFTKGADTSNYRIKTKDNLYGLQLGAVLEINPNQCWTWTFQVKGAGFVNDAKNRLRIKDENNTIVFREYSKQRTTDTWLLEGYGKLAFHFSSYVDFHFAYQGYILAGLALAPEQRDISARTSSRIKKEGQIVIDGLLAGATISF